jgi:hypothetical protein
MSRKEFTEFVQKYRKMQNDDCLYDYEDVTNFIMNHVEDLIQFGHDYFDDGMTHS